MKIDPESDIIALIRYNGDWMYYAAPSEFWALDSAEWLIDVVHMKPGAERKPEVFIAKAAPYRLRDEALTTALRSQWESHPHWEEILHLFPKVFIDVDQSVLFSINVEGFLYEGHVPEGWTGEWKDFYGIIPPEHRYWIDGENDYLRKSIEQQADEDAKRWERYKGTDILSSRPVGGSEKNGGLA